MKQAFIILLILVFVAHSNAQNDRQTKKEERAELQTKGFEFTKNLLESKRFKFIGSLNNTNNNMLAHGIEINGNTVSINLPFVGQKFSSSDYGSQSTGLVFDGEIDSYDLTINEKKKKFRLKIVTKSKSERITYNFDIDAFSYAYVTAVSDKRTNMIYDGPIKPL